MERFVITRKPDGMFQFDYRDEYGQIIFYGGSYTRKTICINGIHSVKQNSQDLTRFIKKMSPSDNLYYFNLKSFNGKIIAKSEFFNERESRNNFIESIKENAQNAIIEDQSRLSNRQKRTPKNTLELS